MQEQELLDLLKDMSLDEKINQMVQLNADFYDIEENGDSITGPMLEMGLTKDQVWQVPYLEPWEQPRLRSFRRFIWSINRITFRFCLWQM